MVLQVAACRQLKLCYGIEKADTPARYAEVSCEQFCVWLICFNSMDDVLGFIIYNRVRVHLINDLIIEENAWTQKD